MAYTNIDDPSAHFQTLAYRGNSTSTTTSDRSLTNEGNSDLQPDLVWIANRDTAINSGMRWWDSTRGVGQNLGITSTGANVEGSPNDPEYGYVNSLNTNGFGVRAGSNDSNGRWTVDRGEGGGDKYVAWQWKANSGTTSSNTDGNITSTVQANTDAGFSIVEYTGNGLQDQTIGHGLGAVPKMVLYKCTSESQYWYVYHIGTGNDTMLYLNLSNGAQSLPSQFSTPTTSTFNVSNENSTFGGYNSSGRTYIAYVFAEKQGFSKFGKYEGMLGSTNPIYTGFKPALVIIKKLSAENWVMVDAAREPSNAMYRRLFPNLTNAENTGVNPLIDFHSNGFRIVTTSTTVNSPDTGYIYCAWAENPFVTSTGIPTTAR
jgi:hypothetical protein